MTEVIYQPRKQIIIHEYSYYDTVEDLIRGTFAGAPPGVTAGPLRWVDGIVLRHTTYPMTDTVVKELIEGRVHWDHVAFAPMEEYRPTIHLEDMQITVKIANVSANPIFQTIAKFIKEELMKK
ncbi:hypothetical protein DRO64_00340 [Candidatus Bathyarchaeota archaeon]|nr:MAG: hypothetical protein DRO64_00340 [Candidatus Bathyarchaeota archaeon]